MKPPLVVFFVAIFLMAGFGAVAPLISEKLFPSNKQAAIDFGAAPHFVLTDTENGRFDSNSLSGKIWVANFFFTSCDGPCPIMSANMAILQERFKDNPQIELVSITIDPKRDTPEKLTKYAAKFAANKSKWHLLTGDKEKIYDVAINGFKLAATEQDFIHSTRFVLVSQNGTIKNYYDGTDSEELLKLQEEIHGLL